MIFCFSLGPRGVDRWRCSTFPPFQIFVVVLMHWPMLSPVSKWFLWVSLSVLLLPLGWRVRSLECTRSASVWFAKLCPPATLRSESTVLFEDGYHKHMFWYKHPFTTETLFWFVFSCPVSIWATYLRLPASGPIASVQNSLGGGTWISDEYDLACLLIVTIHPQNRGKQDHIFKPWNIFWCSMF